MTTQVESTPSTGDSQEPAVKARLALSEAIRQLTADGTRFDQCVEVVSFGSHSGTEERYTRQLEEATEKADGSAKGLTRRHRAGRIAHLAQQLSTVASVMNLKASLATYRLALNRVYMHDASAQDELTALSMLRAVQGPQRDEVGGYRYPFLSTDKLRYLDLNFANGNANLTITCQEDLDRAYHEFHQGAIKSIDVDRPYFSGGAVSSFVSWRGCRNHMVGAHLLAMHQDISARQGERGPEHWSEAMPNVEHGCNMVNEPQYESRRQAILAEKEHGKSLLTARLDMDQRYRRAHFLKFVDDMQAYLRDLKVFEGELINFIQRHRQNPKLDERCAGYTDPKFEQLAAKSNLVMAVTLLPGVTALYQNWHKQMVERYLPRADVVRAVTAGTAYLFTEQVETALSGITNDLVEHSAFGRLLAEGLKLSAPEGDRKTAAAQSAD